MGQAFVVRRFEATAQSVWELLSWRGMARLAGEHGLFAAVDFESDKDVVGATKRVNLRFGMPLRERLEWLDEAGMGYGYRIVDCGSLPVTDYEGSVRVTACGPNASVAVIRCSFVGVNVDDAAWAEEWRAMENGVLDSVAVSIQPGGEGNATPIEDIAAIIRARSDRFESDFALGHAPALVANYYVDEPRIIMPDSPMLIGRAAACEMFTEMMANFSQCRLQQIDVRKSGDMAYEVSDATVVPRDPGAEPLAVRYLIIWSRVFNDWRVAIDFFGWGHLGVAPPER